MALTYQCSNRLQCLSTDTKPTTVPTYSRLYETDTNLSYIFDGTNWKMSDPLMHDYKRFGMHSFKKTDGDGILGTLTSVTLTTSVDTTLNRGRQRAATGAVSDTTAGWRGQTNTWVMRSMNPKMYVEFRCNATANFRLYLGFAVATAVLSGNDPLNAISGFMFGNRSTDTAWQIMNNDGSGATNFTAVTGTVTTFDTNLHKLWVVGDAANNQFGISIDGQAYQYISSDIPAANTALNCHMEIQNSTAADQTFDLFNWVAVADNG